ncbi:MAG: hypothetical protein ACOC0U_03830 [Desulfovibrionales bacterium]
MAVKFTDFLHAARDSAVGLGSRAVLNKTVMKEYGQVLDLKIDSAKKTAWARVQLLGEAEPVQVEIGRYELARENGKHYLHIETVRASREWMDTLARQLLAGRRFEINENLYKNLKLIL